MRILVTGHQGFIGSNVAAHLMAEGHEVVGYDDGSSGVNFSPSGISQWDATPEKIEGVVHCAAYADIRNNWKSHSERRCIFTSNIELTWDLLDWAELHTKPFIFMSTAAVYGPNIGNENNPTQATSPYAASKIAAEAYVQAYVKNHTIFRLGCVVGKNYHHGHIADFAKQALRTGTITPLSDGAGLKTSVHVKDVCGAVSLALTGKLQGIFNLAHEDWCPRDTARVMGLRDVNWPSNAAGWPGDHFSEIESEWYQEAGGVFKYSIDEGVREALYGLGWGV